MTDGAGVTLEPAVCRHGFALSVLARVVLWPAGRADGIAVSGGKQPLAVLLHDGTTLRGVDLAGRVLSPDAVERLLPGATRSMAAAWQDHHHGTPAAAFSGDGD